MKKRDVQKSLQQREIFEGGVKRWDFEERRFHNISEVQICLSIGN